MQKQKADRKKKKQMHKAVTTAKSQITGFLQTWELRVIETTTDFTHHITSNIDDIIESYKLPIFTPFEKDIDQFTQENQQLEELLQTLKMDMKNYQKDVQKTITWIKDEEIAMKKEIQSLRKNVVDYYRADCYGVSSSSGRCSSSSSSSSAVVKMSEHVAKKGRNLPR